LLSIYVNNFIEAAHTITDTALDTEADTFTDTDVRDERGN